MLKTCTQRLNTTSKTVVLTGAGISAESGIPTFRGEEGFWVVGSKNYRPQELATREAFDRMPAEIWNWYLYRRAKCREAKPNPAHYAIAQLERELGSRFSLITQNVDGLHLAAGNSLEQTYQIHGNIHYIRCNRNCESPIPLPPEFDRWRSGRGHLSLEQLEPLRCAHCGSLTRPHVLWFDEYYDETNFRFESALSATAHADLLVIIGTTGTTNLPMQLCRLAIETESPVIIIDPNPNSLTNTIERYAVGSFLKSKASNEVPRLAEKLIRLSTNSNRRINIR